MRLKLGLHLIPKSSFCLNLRNAIGQRRWFALSRKIRAENNFTCQFCGSKEDPSHHRYTHLHEIWDFNEKTNTQTLVGFECLCQDCHHTHHWMFSEYKGFDLELLIEHACKVNGCSRDQFEKHIVEEKEKWLKRSKIEWALNFGDWEHLI